MASDAFHIEICDDVREECSKFGTILELKVPRPVGGSRQSAGVGKIFVKFDTTDACTKALRALAGRKFADRTVVATYFPEVSFSRILHHPCLTNANPKTPCPGELRGRSLVGNRCVEERYWACQFLLAKTRDGYESSKWFLLG